MAVQTQGTAYDERRGDDEIGGNADVDEFLLDGYSEGKRSRNLDNKQAVLIVAEQLEDGRTGKIGLKHIENFEADTLQCAIGQMTSLEINLTADSYSSYKLLQSIKVAYLKTGG